MFLGAAVALQVQGTALIRIELDRLALVPLDAHQPPDITGAKYDISEKLQDSRMRHADLQNP